MEVFRLITSLDQFRFLLCCLRFDKKATRDEGKEDELATFRQIIEMFVQNCKNNYIPSEYMTINKMLAGVRGKCPFRQHIPCKPDKYGIKIHALRDAKTFYVWNTA